MRTAKINDKDLDLAYSNLAKATVRYGQDKIDVEEFIKTEKEFIRLLNRKLGYYKYGPTGKKNGSQVR